MPDRIQALQAFVTVCDAAGFAAAARRLHLAPSAVTRLVAGLERRLGARLLQRTTRSVKLTEAGGRFLERARRILAELEEAELSVQDDAAHPRGTLVVAAPLLFGRLHVAPLLSAYLDWHRQARAELLLSDRLASLVEEGIDVAIRIGALADSALVARRLAQTRRIAVASPAYLATAGTPLHPRELAGHALVMFHAVLPGPDWAFADQNGGTISVPVAARFATNSGDAAIAHALGGGGITMTFSYQVDEALRSGTLVEVLAEFAPAPVPIQAVFPSARLLSGKVRAFLDLAEARARAWRFGDDVRPGR